jgi:toxin ParE1/3/4
MRGTPRDDLVSGLRVIGFELRVLIAYTTITDTVVIQGVFAGGRNFERTLRRNAPPI